MVRTSRTPRAPLPIPRTSFIGRHQELAAIDASITEGTRRLLTLTGPGGVGKSRLAVRAAETVAPRFNDGAAFVALSAVSDPIHVAPTVARALGVHLAATRSPVDSLTRSLRDRHLLLILDNLEQAAGAALFVAELLTNCPSIVVLATSRVPLRLSDELVYTVLPLALPDPDVEATAEAMADVESVSLFVARARESKPEFVLTDTNVTAVADICRRLDGLPLAIELAAARMRHLSPVDLRARLEGGLGLLTDGVRDQPRRLQTMHEAIAWSYALLRPSEKLLFRRLAVFNGGFTLEAARAITGGNSASTAEDHWLGAAPDEIVEGIAVLVDHSLLRHRESFDGSSRYGMLQTIRDFALNRLVEEKEDGATRHAHADYFLTLAERFEAVRLGTAPREACGNVGMERANLREALRWFRQQGDRDEALRLASALWPLWLEQADLAEGRQCLTDALAMPGASTRGWPLAKATAVAALLAQAQGNFDEAKVLANRALALARECGDQRSAAVSLTTLGLIAMVQGDAGEAESLLKSGHHAFRAIGDRQGDAWTVRHLGSLAYYRGDLPAAVAYAEEGIEAARAVGNDVDIARSLHTLGVAVAVRSDPDAAADLWNEALARFHQAGDRWGVADTLTSLADVASERGDTTDAKRLLDESLSIHREIGSPGVAFVLSRRGWLARRSGDPVGAARLFDEGLARSSANSEARNVVQVMLGLGAVSFDLGALDEARRRVAEALRLAFDIGDHLAIVASLRWFAIVLGERGVPEHATRLLGAAAALRTRLGVSIWPSARIDEEVCIAGLVAQLGETAYAASWEEGASLPLTVVIESALAGVMVRPAQDASTALSPVLTMLTPRERTVLRLLAEGLSDKEIAEALEPKVSVRTAQSHVSSVLHKLGVETRKGAQARAKAENIGTLLPFPP